MVLVLSLLKYCQRFRMPSFIVVYIIVILGCISFRIDANCYNSSPSSCSGNGMCKNNSCICHEGWQGPQCQFCGGKVRLAGQSGIIHDGNGNYSNQAKCSWLINAPNSSITLHIEDFATECGWDHLYVFDGDSVDSPLLAAFSGIMYKNNYGIRKIPEVVAHTGSALLHFSSDDGYNMSGFNIKYRLNACPSKVSGIDCSGNGICLDGVCFCNSEWSGIACHLMKCPNNCWRNESRGSCELEKGCVCNSLWKGEDCGQLAHLGFWESVTPQGYTPPGSASHGAIVWNNSMYVIAGETFNRRPVLNVYDFNDNIWKFPNVIEDPAFLISRNGHSTVLYDNKLFIYGGVVGKQGPTSNLWAFDLIANTWKKIKVKAKLCNSRLLSCGPLKSTGHSSTVITNQNNKKLDKMVVIFGHSPTLGYLNTVQEYYFNTNKWRNVSARGYPVKGGYGHTASWDNLSRKIYVYGGIISENKYTQLLSSYLYSYDVDTQIWTLLTDAPSSRFLHTSVFISPGLMLVFGGNTHTDTLHSSGAKCYSSEVLSYDVECDSWHTLNITSEFQSDLARFGHSAVMFQSSLYIYGGFDGQMLSDIIKYSPGECGYLSNPTTCLNAKIGVKCVWDHNCSKCVHIENIPQTLLPNEDVITKCSKDIKPLTMQPETIKKDKCEKFENCTSCVQTTNKCMKSNSEDCTYTKCHENCTQTKITNLRQYPVDQALICKQLHSCIACHSQSFCRWDYQNFKCGKMETFSKSIPQNFCPEPCAEYTSCSDCSERECVWCQNQNRCVDGNAYTLSFPYGQCREWIIDTQKCTNKRNHRYECGSYSTCETCRENLACGWCDDGSKTGLGKCIPGGYAGPRAHLSNKCPSERWHFTTCPTCQCNGHATCYANTSTCLSCADFTTGPHCEQCINGRWGNPTNGGKCRPCECNGQTSRCDAESGKCYCSIKGSMGHNCEKCDVMNHYYKDSTKRGFCFYELITDYRFAFNLSKKTDRNFTQINFRNSPMKSDVDVHFGVTCSEMSKINITVKKANSGEEKPIYINYNCTNNTFETVFKKNEYRFGIENNVTLTTFNVYIYDFQAPVWVQISFAQYNQKYCFDDIVDCIFNFLLNKN